MDRCSWIKDSCWKELREQRKQSSWRKERYWASTRPPCYLPSPAAIRARLWGGRGEKWGKEAMAAPHLGKPGIGRQPPMPWHLGNKGSCSGKQQKHSRDQRRGAFQMRVLNVWNPGAKKDVAKCHTEHRHAFLGPECEGHEQWKGKSVSKENHMDSGACAGPGQALLHAVLQGAGETTVQQWARPALHTSCPHLHVGSGKGRRWAGSLKGIGTVRFRTKPGPSTCRTKFALNKMCVGGGTERGVFPSFH